MAQLPASGSFHPPSTLKGQLVWRTPQVGPRQAAWAGIAALVAAIGVGVGFGAATLAPLAAVAGIIAAYPRKVRHGLHLLMALLVVGFLLPPAWTWLGVALAGAFTVWIGEGKANGWRMLNGGLVAIIGTGLMGWLMQLTVPVMAPYLYETVAAGFFGFGLSQVLWLEGFVYEQSDRIPNKGIIRRTLHPRYREPCFRAWSIDRAIANSAPDQESREGLQEVASWVYRLSWSLQSLDREVASSQSGALEDRIARLKQEAEEAVDDFTQERKLAATGHLERTLDHHRALSVERQRTEAILEYALAFLEEARAGLAVARIQPGAGSPERLEDVLARLRTYAEEREIEAKARFEVHHREG